LVAQGDYKGGYWTFIHTRESPGIPILMVREKGFKRMSERGWEVGGRRRKRVEKEMAGLMRNGKRAGGGRDGRSPCLVRA
jgi:hypothetical protein